MLRMNRNIVQKEFFQHPWIEVTGKVLSYTINILCQEKLQNIITGVHQHGKDEKLYKMNNSMRYFLQRDVI